MLAMVIANTVTQLLTLQSQYKNKSKTAKLKECLITLLFMRPGVDAYRVSTNYQDSEVTVDSLSEMIANKVCARNEYLSYLRNEIDVYWEG